MSAETGASAPRLAVVGHPNKGKSSLVATLAQDDSVAIGATPGTTRSAREYPMRVDGRHLYTLVDTPGFQRARGVLGWLTERAAERGATAADRPELVAELVDDRDCAARFPDECELLRPLVAGAGILYVVDGSVPYGPEYEAEMEVLRWTGCPSMAIVNPIGTEDHIAEWRSALGQFFRVVRVIDAMRADFATRRQLLLAFGELEADWRAPIELAVEALDAERAAKRVRAAKEIAELLGFALSLVVERRLDPDEDPSGHRAALELEYQQALDRRERDHRRRVQAIYGHHDLEAHAAELELLETDLFSEGSWLRFGLRRRDLVTAAAAGGAATGGALDVAVGGASLLAGAAIGAAIGGMLGFLGVARLAELRVVDRPLGGRLARYGPSRNANYPFVLFGRARYHCGLLAARTHAMREAIELDVDLDARQPLDGAARRQLEGAFSALRKAGSRSPAQAEAEASLARTTEAILQADEKRAGENG